MRPLEHKLNNSYESEQSSSNGSINEAITSEPSAITPSLNLHLPDLFAVDRINNSLKMNNLDCASKNNSDELIVSESEANDFDSELTQYSNTFSSAEISDQNERVIKELDKAKLTKILKTFTSNESKCSMQRKTCDHNIDKSPSVMFNMENSCNASDNKIANRSTAKKCDRDLSFKLNFGINCQRNRMPSSLSTDKKVLEAKKIPMQRREQSPDLFDDYMDSDDETNNENVLEDSTSNYPGSADTSTTTETTYWEKTLYKRLQTSLSGVLPPPSKTIIQYSISELVSLYSENLSKMSACEVSELNHSKSLFKPTHTVEQIRDVGWEELTKDVKCHGLLYNRTTYSEDIELLCMKLAERCVGVETSSSFTHCYRPSVNKARMKLLSESPGTRLSHLVGRKRGLSSANLMSKQCGSDSSKLGSKQLVIDVQKNFNRKRKATTPKRRPSAKKRTPGRKTPGSQRKRLALSAKSMTPTRETSKRALFQSPPQQKPKPTFPLDLARRVDRSKRILFSPSKDEHDKNLGSLSQPNLKRRRDEDGLLGNQSKIPRMNGLQETSTPRSLLAKSQTFCVTTTNELLNRTSSVHRARSDVTLSGSQQLSQSHRKKLLWAVSTALKKKNIHTQHPNFIAFAGVLAKVVKRLFLESRDESISTSDTMIRIADRLVFWVVQGKTVDEIYLNEKIRKENVRAACQTKLKGYIALEDYEKLKKPMPKYPSNLFLSQSSTDSFSLSQSFNLNAQSQHSNLSQNTESLLSDHSLSNNCFNETRSLSALPETVNYALCSSSSKSNTSGSVLRENVRESELKQKSGQKLVEFSGKDQKNVSPYHDSKVMFGGSRTNIMNVKRQISFDA